MKLFVYSLALLMVTTVSASTKFMKTVNYVDIDRFMGTWYVMAVRPTVFEKGAVNSIERYDRNPKNGNINVTFVYNKDSFDGKITTIKQKARVFNTSTNAHWKISLFWPVEFDYLVIALDDKDYSWCAVGVPNQDFLWIMTREYTVGRDEVNKMVEEVAKTGYSVDKLIFIEHNYE